MKPQETGAKDQPVKSSSTKLGWFVFGGCAIGTIALGLLASSINERRAESRYANLQIIQPIQEHEADNSKWGVNFPREYQSWESTKQINENTKYGGSAHRDYLKDDPRLIVLFAGFGFSKEYNAPRGHYWALHDVTHIKRVNEKTPATCWTCKSPDVPRVMARDGVDKYYSGKFSDYKKDIQNPIGCADCHNEKTLALQISRPALKEGLASQGEKAPVKSHQEMRSLVCAQCHVSYYFKDKKTNKLIFPWAEGLKADDFDKYYQKVGFSDFTHPISGVRVIKTRHPDYEVYKQGIHAFRGVSCADCHMPYKTEGGIKYTDHQIRSPLYNIAASCGVCHRWSEDDVKKRVNSIQDKNREMLDTASNALVAAHFTVGDAARLGATESELAGPRETLRRAQMYWDYVASNNGMGFHAPQECARVLNKATNLAQECRIATEAIRAKHGATAVMTVPDISTEEKARAAIKPYVDAQKAAEHAKEEAEKQKPMVSMR